MKRERRTLQNPPETGVGGIAVLQRGRPGDVPGVCSGGRRCWCIWRHIEGNSYHDIEQCRMNEAEDDEVGKLCVCCHATDDLGNRGTEVNS